MSFTDLGFPFLLLAVLALMRVLPPRGRKAVLLPVSCFFYACAGWQLLPLLLGVAAVSWGMALWMEKAPAPPQRRGRLILGCVLCLLPLFLFKYLDFALSGLRALGLAAPAAALPLPLGISFYTFQALSYLADVYRGRLPAEKRPWDYFLYVAFFPQLVAGPIERPGDLLPQLRSPRLPSREEQAAAVLRMLCGYTRKVLIADRLAVFVDAAYAQGSGTGGASLLAATVLFAAQIYCDFSGYSEIAVGAAGLLGVRLSENFDRPWAAVSLRDFWRRWHISLTRWLRDSVYIPLGGSRKGLTRQCGCILAVFLISGLWHGADLSFVLWGLTHGLLLAGETVLEKRFHRHPPRLLAHVCICLAWVFFRAESTGQALAVFQTMLTDLRPGELLAGLGMSAEQLPPVLLLLLLIPLLDRASSMARSARPAFGQWWLCLLLFLAAASAWCIAGTQNVQAAFIYFRF